MLEKRKRFREIYPNKYFADESDLLSMASYLNSINFLSSEEKVISAEVPGAGNMNYVLRVKTDTRSFILKQSRPWVEKYPSIDAPIERISIEADYFNCLLLDVILKHHSPQVYHVDQSNFILLMEDLGDVIDYTYLYDNQSVLESDILESLAGYLSALHGLEVREFSSNMNMRKLNHEHIFNYPFKSDSGFDLESVQEGLSELVVNETTDPKLIQTISNMGDRYLSTQGGSLLHGDFYPGSWMKSSKTLYVIDAEFGFLGPREFDLGVFIAHMKMANQKDKTVDRFLELYKQGNSVDTHLAYSFAGIEILRRLLGVAQLPLDLAIEKKSKLIALAKEWVMGAK